MDKLIFATERNNDMQKYLVIFQAQGSPSWQHTFARNRKEVVDRAQTKCGVTKVASVWCCDWRNPTAEPELLYGTDKRGLRVVQSLIKETRDINIKTPPPPKPRIKVKLPDQKPLVVAASTALVAVTTPATSPITVTPKAVEPKKEYEPPYEVKKAE